MSADATIRAAMRGLCFRGLLLAALAVAFTSGLQAAEPVIQIEQDWELVVGEPDLDTDAPQVVCVISPLADTNSVHAVLELNHQSFPEYNAGGLQLQLWCGETALTDRIVCNAQNGVSLAHNDETITWTMRMSLNDGKLIFAVLNGQSETWQSFGGYATLAAAVQTSLTGLDSYDPAVSVKSSGGAFAPNRVKSYSLKKTRYLRADGTTWEDNTVRDLLVNQ